MNLHRNLVIVGLVSACFSSTVSRADSGQRLLYFLRIDCRHSILPEEMLKLIMEESGHWDEYKKLSREIDSEIYLRESERGIDLNRLQEENPHYFDLYIQSVEAKLSRFYREKIFPFVERHRARVRRNPFMGTAGGREEFFVDVALGDKIVKGRLRGQYSYFNGGHQFSDPRIQIGNESWTIAGHEAATEIGLMLGYRGADGGSQLEVVTRARDFFFFQRRYLVFDTERLIFRPVEKRDTNGAWLFAFPNRIQLHDPTFD